MTTSPVRQVSRVLILDPDNRVLLLRYRLRDNREVWIPPGGGVEAGESSEEAARREGLEECAIALDAPLSVAWSHSTHYFGRDVLETYFLARLAETPDVLATPEPGAPAELLEYRWWTAAEIAADHSRIEFTPPDLASRMSTVSSAEQAQP